MKRILVITARFPLPALGACEQDRFEGIKALKRLGFEVSVIAKVFSFQPKEEIERFSREFGIPVKTLPYENKFSLKKILLYIGTARLTNILTHPLKMRLSLRLSTFSLI